MNNGPHHRVRKLMSAYDVSAALFGETGGFRGYIPDDTAAEMLLRYYGKAHLLTRCMD